MWSVPRKVRAINDTDGFHFSFYSLVFSSSLNSAVTYQSLENNQVAGGMQGGVEDLSMKSAENAGLTASGQTEIKVKQRSSVTKTFFLIFYYYFISHLSKKRFMIIYLLGHFCICLRR